LVTVKKFSSENFYNLFRKFFRIFTIDFLLRGCPYKISVIREEGRAF